MTNLNDAVVLKHTDTPDATTTDNNVDAGEIQKFTALAAQWWDKNGAFKPLHDINPLRLSFIDECCLRHFDTPLSGKKVVDIGCGGGILAHSMADINADVLGIDMGAQNLQAAILHNQHSDNHAHLSYQCIPAEALADTQAAQFDIVTCMEMLEHVPNPQSIIDACFKLLKPNGLLVASTINRNIKSYLMAIVGAEYILNMLDKGTHDYHKFITPAELDKMANRAGFLRFDMTGLHYNPITKHYWLSNKNVDVNYMMAFIKPCVSFGSKTS